MTTLRSTPHPATAEERNGQECLPYVYRGAGGNTILLLHCTRTNVIMQSSAMAKDDYPPIQTLVRKNAFHIVTDSQGPFFFYFHFPASFYISEDARRRRWE